mmetsp:Transcript_3521/g.8769  ORF Transcript_3521/g.8769 Transcript_3521/m.8769 type:complete len:105 (+) Transcript_3521:69-383(+)
MCALLLSQWVPCNPSMKISVPCDQLCSQRLGQRLALARDRWRKWKDVEMNRLPCVGMRFNCHLGLFCFRPFETHPACSMPLRSIAEFQGACALKLRLHRHQGRL